MQVCSWAPEWESSRAASTAAASRHCHPASSLPQRSHFTLGQAARMRAMLAAYHPQLATAAASGLQATTLVISAAFQSGPPSDATLGLQVTACFEAAGSGCSGSSTNDGYASSSNSGNSNSANGTSNSGTDFSLMLNSVASLQSLSAALVTGRQRLGDPRQQAAAAASGRLSTALQSCSCAGPDGSGSVFWTGQLNGSFWVDAVQLLLPVNVSAAASGGSAASAAAAPPAPWAAPMPEPGLARGQDGPVPNSSGSSNSSSGGSSGQLVEVRIGDSANHSANALCTQQPVALVAPLLRVACDQPAAGQFVTVAALPAAAGSNTSRQQNLCLCAVQPLSFNSSAREAPSARLAAELPLSAAAGVRAGQSSARARAVGRASAALAASTLSLVPPNCSATAAEAHPRWWVSAGLDPLFIRGLRLSTPWPSSAANGSSTLQQASSIGVYVTNALLPAGGSKPPAGSLCAAHVLLPPGQTVGVDCGRVLQGRVVTVVGSDSRGGSSSSLALCSVQLMGSLELHLAGAASLAPDVQLVEPPALLPDFSLVMDGDDATCLYARASGANASSGASGSEASTAMWQLVLAKNSSVVGVHLSGGGGSASVELLDPGGAVAWSAALSAGSSSSSSSRSWYSSSDWLEPAAPVVAAGLRVRGFARLCEARLLVLP